jgi:hypothetical protein
MYEGSLDSSHSIATLAPGMLPALRAVVEIAAGDACHRLVQPAVDHDHLRRGEFREADRFVHEGLQRDRLAHAHPGVARHHDFRRASSMRAARLAAANPPNTTEWMAPMRTVASMAKTASGNHRHVDEDAIALADAAGLEHRGAAVHLVGELREGVLARLVHLRGDPHQRLLVGAHGQVPVDGVVAEVGLAADEPVAEGRPRVVEDFFQGLCQSTIFACSAQKPSGSSMDRR